MTQHRANDLPYVFDVRRVSSLKDRARLRAENEVRTRRNGDRATAGACCRSRTATAARSFARRCRPERSASRPARTRDATRNSSGLRPSIRSPATERRFLSELPETFRSGKACSMDPAPARGSWRHTQVIPARPRSRDGIEVAHPESYSELPIECGPPPQPISVS